jgi:hypothetical protein
MATQPTGMTTDQLALSQILANYGIYAPQVLPSSYQGYAEANGLEFGGNQHVGLTSGGVSGMGTMSNIGMPGLGGAIENFGSGNTEAAVLSLLSGGFSDLLGGLFGSSKPSWKPYLDENGNYFWRNPNSANPVPLSNIPGASIKPSKEYADMANQIRAIQDLLPYFSHAISQQKIPDAAAQLAADTATTGPRLALQESLQRQYGPIFDQLAAESNKRRAMSSAQNDAAVLAGPGQDVIKQALAAAKLYDPEYFATRATTADATQKLLGDTMAGLDGGLSTTEADEINRGLALQSDRRGTANAPSQFDTTANAMQFGQAGRQRKLENQNQLSKAIAASTAFLPTSRSGVDVFQVATGRPSATMDNRFNTNGQDNATANANSLLNTGLSMWNTNSQIKAQQDQQDHWTNSVGAISDMVGSVGSLSTLLMGCWIAREVYGETNPRWQKFRDWLFIQSPDWLFNWYMDNGYEFANYIKDKPLLKRLIRWWMDKKIKEVK